MNQPFPEPSSPTPFDQNTSPVEIEAIPDHLSSVSPTGWYVHWHSERTKGDWERLSTDTRIVERFADVLQLPDSARNATRYSMMVSDLNGALQRAQRVHDQSHLEVLPELLDRVQQFANQLLNNASMTDNLTLVYVRRLSERIKLHISGEARSYVERSPRLEDHEWIQKAQLSLEGIQCYADYLIQSGADCGSIHYRTEKGEITKLVEYLPPWSQDGAGQVLPGEMMSSTKSLAAVVCFVAASRGIMNLDQSIVDIIGTNRLVELDLPDAWRRITPRHLLNQTSGLSRNIQYTSDTKASSMSRHFAVPIEDEPGTSLKYSNVGTQLLAYVLASALEYSGFEGTLRSFTHQYVCAPLGMKQTYFGPVWDNSDIALFDRGLQSTADDFAQLASFLLNPEHFIAPDGLPVLSTNARNQLLQPAAVHFPLTLEKKGSFPSPTAYANCFYLDSYGIGTRGTYNTNMDIVSQNEIVRNNQGIMELKQLEEQPALIFFRQQSENGPEHTSTYYLNVLMKACWAR